MRSWLLGWPKKHVFEIRRGVGKNIIRDKMNGWNNGCGGKGEKGDDKIGSFWKLVGDLL